MRIVSLLLLLLLQACGIKAPPRPPSPEPGARTSSVAESPSTGRGALR